MNGAYTRPLRTSKQSRGQIAGALDDAQRSHYRIRNTLQIDPDFGPALRALGQAYAEKSWFADARRELTRAQKALPDSVPVAVELGKVLIELADWSKSDPKNVIARESLARA